jgi:hypothetical protein
MLGSEFAKTILGKSGAEREALIYSAVANGHMPSWIREAEWKTILLTETIGGLPHTLKLWVLPDYFSIGTDADFLRVPMWPATAQKIATYLKSILPTRKIVDAIYNAADFRTSIGPPKGLDYAKMASTEAFIASNAEINTRIAGKSGLIAGGKKDLVIGPNLDGSHVAIYSTPFSGAGPVRPSDIIASDGVHHAQYQTYPSPHSADFSDYSHGLRLVFGKGELDGKIVNLSDVFDSNLYPLVSDQGGPFLPHFPNVTGSKIGFPPKDFLPPVKPPPDEPPPVVAKASDNRAGIVIGSAIALFLLSRIKQ